MYEYVHCTLLYFCPNTKAGVTFHRNYKERFKRPSDQIKTLKHQDILFQQRVVEKKEHAYFMNPLEHFQRGKRRLRGGGRGERASNGVSVFRAFN